MYILALKKSKHQEPWGGEEDGKKCGGRWFKAKIYITGYPYWLFFYIDLF